MLCLVAVAACSFIAVTRRQAACAWNHCLLDFECVVNLVPARVLNGGSFEGSCCVLQRRHLVQNTSPLRMQLQANAKHICSIQG